MNSVCKLLIAKGVAAAMLAAMGTAAWAGDQVLIMTIGEYSGAPLLGVKHDAANGKAIAEKLGFDTRQARILKDSELTLSGMRSEFQRLITQAHGNDRVFIYYSGHGGSHKVENQCQQSLISQDSQHFTSGEFMDNIAKLKEKAGKVFVVLDACHSQGTFQPSVSRNLGKAIGTAITAKTWTPKEGESCAYPANIISKGLPELRGGKSMNNLDQNYVFIAAARDNEHALDNEESGGLASNALLKCLNTGVPDLDNSGAVTVGELATCAQGHITRGIDEVNRNSPGAGKAYTAHHITVAGGAELPLLSVKTSAQPSNSKTDPVATLNNIAAGADHRWNVRATPSVASTSVNKGTFRLRYESSEPGYAYIVYAGSDRKEYKQLYPVKPGDLRRVEAGSGEIRATFTLSPPVGDNSGLLIIARTPMNFDVFQPTTDGSGNVVAATVTNGKKLQCATMEKRNATAKEDEGACAGAPKDRNLTAKEDAGDNEIATYGAAMFVVRGE